MRFRVLGAVELVGPGGDPVPVGSANQRTVLAVLLACRGEVVAIDALIEALWGDDPPASAVPTLRTYVSRLRAHLGGVLASRGGGFALDVRPGELDAGRFEELVAAARHAAPEDGARLLGTALDLWEGPAFGDRADVERVRGEARRLDELRLAAHEARAGALLRAGRAAEAAAAAEALVTAEPLREGGWAVLVEALAAAHRPADALRAFQRAAAVLADAGLEPSGRLRQAERTALRDDRPPEPPGGNAPARHPPRFRPPAVPTSFVGRSDDVQRIAELLGQTRLVTLVGPGGVGKTRLALEVAHRAADGCELGACVVELAPVVDAAAVADVVVATLGLAATGLPAADLLPRVGALGVLVVLDNAEHVIDAAAATADAILAGGRDARILATSRERLAVDGEHVWTVAPLATAGAEPPAARLFRERASALGAVPAADLVDRVVRRLDGLPLAIEMAAAQLDTTTVEELADLLDQHLDDLRSPRRNAPARHRSLADVLDWSEGRLDEVEARTLAELSVFAGPVAGGDIEGVLGHAGVVDVVRALAGRSLVSVDLRGPHARFHLLQTVRSFAARRLAQAGRSEEMSRRHAEWFTEAARAADDQLRTAEEVRGHERIESVLAEVRTAQGWAARNALELAAELAGHLHLYAQSRFIEEPLLWAELLLAQVAPDHRRRPILLTAAATRALRRGDLAQARLLAVEALELAGETRPALQALDVLTDAGLFDGRLDQSARTARSMRDLARRHGDLLYLALAHSGMALSAAYGTGADADVEAEMDALDDLPLPPSGRGWLAYTRAELCQRDDPERALAHFADALAEARAVHNRYVEGATIVSSCSLRARIGDPGDALVAFAEAVRHWLRLANTTQQLTTLRNLAVLFQRAGAAEALAELLGAVDRDDVPTYGEEAERLAGARRWAVTALGRGRFDACHATGAARDVTAAASRALEVIDALTGAAAPA